MANALRDAESLKMDCVQVFTKNQRQWSTRAIPDAERDDWLATLKRLRWDDPADFRVISHNSYLVNVASPEEGLWERSVVAQRGELERCEALGIAGCVMHPGAHLDASSRAPRLAPPSGEITAAERAGLLRVVKALDRLHRELRGFRTLTLLETTAGSGTSLGFDFAHLAFVQANLREPQRVAFCFDTCHVTAAGYDMSTREGAEAVWQRWDETCGRESVRAFHLNDSVGALGSRVDRHAHIGDGCCGKECFRFIMNRPEFTDVPKILETPKGDDERGRPWDVVNMQRLRKLR
jgi:deoxyribonuclease-4